MHKLLTIMFLFCSVSLADIVQPLDLREFWGVDRNGEFFSGGVPVPKGLITIGDRISVWQGGVQLPLQTRPLMRWPDGSLRWVLLTFQGNASRHAINRAEVRFHQYSSASAVSPTDGTLTINNETDKIAVSTGVMKFTVRKNNGFNLFDAVMIDSDNDGAVDDTIVHPSLNNGAIFFDHWDSTYTSGKDSSVLVTVEENGPVRSIIKILGNHSNGKGEKRFYGYQCRIFVYAGQSYVDVHYTVKNSYNTPRGTLAFNGMRLSVKPSLSGAQTVTLFDKVLRTSALVDSAWLFQPYQYGFQTKINGNELNSVNRTNTAERSLGWMDLSDANKGVAVGIYEFASQCPKEVFASKDGAIEARLWPNRYEQGTDSVNYSKDAPETDRFFIGMAEHKTHQLRYYFHSGSAEASGVADKMAAFNHPLQPEMTREWISRSRALPGELYPDTVAVPNPSMSTYQLPLVNAPLSSPAYTSKQAWGKGYYDSWVTFGESFDRNNTGSTEYYENQGLRYFRYLSPTVKRLFESNARLYSDMRRCHLDSVVGFDPSISMHFWYRKSDTAKHPVHTAPLPYNASTNLGKYRLWIAPTPAGETAHYSGRDLFLHYLLTGDLKSRDGLYDFTEFQPQFRVWRYYSSDSRMDRVGATCWATMWMSAVIENDEIINGTKIQDYFKNQLTYWTNGTATKKGILASMLPFDAWNDTFSLGGISGPHNFMEALVDMPFYWYSEYFWNDSLSSYVNRRVSFWRDRVIGENGGIVYHGWAPPSNDSGVNVSNWRIPGALAMLYQLSGDTGLERKMNRSFKFGANSIFNGPNIDLPYFGKYDITAFQPYMFYSMYRDSFRVNPMITWENSGIGTEVLEMDNNGINIWFKANPNPFNPETKISYSVPVALKSVFKLYDSNGRLIRRISLSSEGKGSFVLSGVDNYVKKLSAGVYFGAIETSNNARVVKSLLLMY